MTKKPPSPRRRAPVQARSKATVSAIQQAALQILETDGYARATTVHIAEVAGVSVGTLYQYFDGREAVFEGVTEELLTSVTQVVDAALTAPGASSLRARLHASVWAVLSVLARHPHALRRLDAIPDSTFRERLVDTKRRAREVVQEVLVAHADELRLPDPALAARMVADFGEGVAYNLQADDDVARLAEESTNLLVAYLWRSDPDPG